MEKVRVNDEKRRTVWAAALLSIVLGISWKEEEQKKLLTSSHSELAFCWIDLLPPLYKSWSCSFLPVEVSCRGLFAASTMSFHSKIGLFKRTMEQTIIFLQEKVEAESRFFKKFQRQGKFSFYNASGVCDISCIFRKCNLSCYPAWHRLVNRPRLNHIVAAVYSNGSGPAMKNITGFSHRKQNSSARRSPTKFASSMKKGGQLELMALLRTVLGIS